MKKLLYIALAILMVFLCASCKDSAKSTQTETAEPKEPQEIVLTVENIEEYFTVKAYTSNYTEDATNTLAGGWEYDCECDLNIEVVKKVEMEVKDVTLRFTIHSTWSSIEDVKTECGETFIELKLDENGEAKKTSKCTYSTYSSQKNSTPIAELSLVTGSIVA